MTTGVEPLKLPPQSPNLNAFAERWGRTVKETCLDQLILFGERSRRHALQEFLAHHQHERNHQGLANIIHFILLSLGASSIVSSSRATT